jgi:regulator of nucleoside diphosphate kinase
VSGGRIDSVERIGLGVEARHERTIAEETAMNRKMLLGDPPPIRITAQDLQRLDALLTHLSESSPVASFLQREVDRAEVTDGTDGTSFVRIGTRLSFSDEQGVRHTGTLVLPEQLKECQDGISILTPIGSALLGLSEGQAIEYTTLDGRTKTITVLSIDPA